MGSNPRKDFLAQISETFSRLPYRRALGLFALLLLIIAVSLTIFLVRYQQDLCQRAAGTGQFHVQGNKIIDPNGNPFVVKGIDAIYGRFAGGDQIGYGLTNYNHAERDLDILKGYGINLIRLSVSAEATIPGNARYIPNYMQELDNVIGMITQRGFVAELSQGETEDPNLAAHFLGQLATRYKTHPFVWIKADNEPFCITNDKSHCYDWAYWQQQHLKYVQAIRNGGYNGPIVINCIDWSWDCSKISQYPLNDTNLIYGSHMYSNGATSFWNNNNTGPSVADNMWANLSKQYAMIVDEVGSFGGAQLGWNAEFLDYAVKWVQTRGGNGVIAFTYHWSDANNMSDSTGHWNDWGNIYYTHYLSKISSSPVVRYSGRTTKSAIPSLRCKAIDLGTSSPGTMWNIVIRYFRVFSALSQLLHSPGSDRHCIMHNQYPWNGRDRVL